MVRLGLTVTAHRSEQDDINGRSLIIVANPVTGGPRALWVILLR
jgi:hypothetical protein